MEDKEEAAGLVEVLEVEEVAVEEVAPEAVVVEEVAGVEVAEEVECYRDETIAGVEDPVT